MNGFSSSDPAPPAPEPADRWREFVAGKRVAIVGPSRSIVGSGCGPAIDRHDVVVRINHGWPVPPPLRPDCGTRIDVLYHCCNGDHPVLRVFGGEAPPPRWVCHERGRETAALLDACAARGVETLDVTPAYDALREKLGTFPNTGTVAIEHLLDAGVASLAVYGMTFFREPYRAGYLGDGAAAEHWAGAAMPERIWKHDMAPQYEHFRRRYRDDPRLRVEARSLRVMPEVAAAAPDRPAADATPSSPS